MLKRCLDVSVSLCALVVLSPLLLAIAVIVMLEDGAPVLYRQQRVGLGGRRFELLKFRSMYVTDSGPQITVATDSRITTVGRFLRGWKLDELPQLWNVLIGDMSLVGPRPEVERYVSLDDTRWQTVLSVKPGLTELASLIYRNEEALLATAADPESFYRTVVLPSKLAMNIDYVRRRSMRVDLLLIAATAMTVVLPNIYGPEQLRQMIGYTERG
jgi:lipopolysaccharide/colanic/teichoic acid biosynthesis glycosyltransferase